MKKIYSFLFFTLIGSQVSFAQLTLTKAVNEPIFGDVVTNLRYDSTTVMQVPKNTGAGQSWNFNAITVNTSSETITYTTIASAPNATAFPTSTMASNRGGNSWEYWKANSGSLEYTGSSVPSSNDLTVFSNYATWINWPTSYGSANSDAFLASQTTGTNTSNWNGNLSYTATGSGTVTLPGGNVHNNCLQLKKVITLTLTSVTNTTQILMVNYEYWSSSSKFPILSAEYQTITTGTNVTKGFSIYVNKTAQSVGVNELKFASSNLVIYPNPTKDFVNVLLPNNAIAENLQVIDVNGKIIAQSFNINSIDLTGISQGVYFVRVQNKEFVLQKLLVITE